jgi:hypothetical protein
MQRSIDRYFAVLGSDAERVLALIKETLSPIGVSFDHLCRAAGLPQEQMRFLGRYYAILKQQIRIATIN